MENLVAIILYKKKIEYVLHKYDLALETLETNDMAFDLCAFYLSQIVENMNQLPKEIKLLEKHYKELNSLRHTIQHNYKSLNKEQFIDLLSYVLSLDSIEVSIR